MNASDSQGNSRWRGSVSKICSKIWRCRTRRARTEGGPHVCSLSWRHIDLPCGLGCKTWARDARERIQKQGWGGEIVSCVRARAQVVQNAPASYQGTPVILYVVLQMGAEN